MTAFIAALQAAIFEATGRPFGLPRVRCAPGGDSSDAQVIDDGERRYFVKRQPAARRAMFETEAAGLAALGAHLRVPGVVACGETADEAFLVLEALDLRGAGDAAALGEALARMHRAPQAAWGWQHNNFIGRTQQFNAPADDWMDFWRSRRLGVQLRLAAQNGLPGALLRDGERLMADLPAFFTGHAPIPSLLHGDLWGGNHAYLADGSPVLFDPAVYCGDRECDLAMTELFGGFAADFHAAYRAAWPLEPGYATRKKLYNLYHVLNHANLFGGGYAAQAANMAQALLAEIR
ncbi:MAG: fructosamine kinase family protein [Thiobacillus sp.]|nr:fructosamine kinase family protein [Thiobacillus sp.]